MAMMAISQGTWTVVVVFAIFVNVAVISTTKAASLSKADQPIVHTTNGTIAGNVEGGVAVFFGIPFAAPPIGNLRFKSPSPHARWTDTLQTTTGGAHCVQGIGPMPTTPCDTWCEDHGYKPDACGCGVCGSYGGCSWSCDANNGTKANPLHKCPTHNISAVSNPEDCLFLNAFVPQVVLPTSVSNGGASSSQKTALKPIMFYIHGGGFVGGSATTGAGNMANLTGHIVFAIQYRLGVLGFFSTETVPTNLGLADQRFALQWVIDNARAFGGDPSNIMIFGCSAGGASVAGMLTMPEAFGMYSAAAIESPGGHQGWMGDRVRSDDDWMATDLNLNNSVQLATELGCDSRSNISCLQSIELATLWKPSLQMRFAPAMPVSGDFPLGMIQRGDWNKEIPVIIGGQSCESCGAAVSVFGPYTRDGVSDAQFRAALVKSGFSGEYGSAVGPDTLVEWYSARIAAEGRWRTFARILSDSGHACSSTLHAKALGNTSAKVWRYFFAYAPTGEGATHGGDESWLMVEHEHGTPVEVALSHDMAFWWTSLNVWGDPNKAANVGAPVWKPYSPDSNIVTMFLGNGKDPHPRMNSSIDTIRSECEHWKPYLGW